MTRRKAIWVGSQSIAPLLMLWSMVGVGSAQDQTTYTTYDTLLTFAYPANWELLDRDGQVILDTQGGTTILLTPAPAQELGLTRQSSPQEALDFFLAYFTTNTDAFTPLPPTTLQGQAVVSMAQAGEGQTSLLLVLQAPHGDFLFLAAVSTEFSTEELTQHTTLLLESLVYRRPLQERFCEWVVWGCGA